MPKKSDKEAAAQLAKVLFKSVEIYLLCLAKQMKEGNVDTSALDKPREALFTIIDAAIMEMED